jgi:hypothetical protein
MLEALRHEPIRHNGGDGSAVLFQHHVMAVPADADLRESDPVVPNAGLIGEF